LVVEDEDDVPHQDEGDEVAQNNAQLLGEVEGREGHVEGQDREGEQHLVYQNHIQDEVYPVDLERKYLQRVVVVLTQVVLLVDRVRVCVGLLQSFLLLFFRVQLGPLTLITINLLFLLLFQFCWRLLHLQELIKLPLLKPDSTGVNHEPKKCKYEYTQHDVGAHQELAFVGNGNQKGVLVIGSEVVIGRDDTVAICILEVSQRRTVRRLTLDC
jgi:hypothetical protein